MFYEKWDGDALLQLMHGRQSLEGKCRAYWLEFNADEEFAGKGFGSIAGGSAYMFGLYQRKSDGAWISGSGANPKVLSAEDAVAKARQQCAELLAGAGVLAASSRDTSDEAYGRLQVEMGKSAPELSGIGRAHKYWFLTHPDRLDDYHSPRYQRYHLFKLLQMPPDRLGILMGARHAFYVREAHQRRQRTERSGHHAPHDPEPARWSVPSLLAHRYDYRR